MIKSGLIGATALTLTLALAAPAMARDIHRVKGPARGAPAYAYAYAEPRLPVQDATRWGYGQGYSTAYPSGFGGLYGDGRYPGNTISNYRP